MAALLSEPEIAAELAAYQVVLPPEGLTQLRSYLDLLLHWNRRVNLTGLREPRDIVRRLFGESLFLTTVVSLRGWLVDVGSGAGFPGLALKLAVPEL
ncbi:MAG: RsmG family class I SAM-dependent methyltransferase, partial [Candidatus Acidiferrales bacterium]